jgi:hypothetical protein
MNEQELNDAIQKLVVECKWHFQNSADYYSKKNEFQRREQKIIKPIGQKIYDTGGLSLMREVYEKVEKKCLIESGQHCRSALDMKWNGVGDWRS